MRRTPDYAALPPGRRLYPGNTRLKRHFRYMNPLREPKGYNETETNRVERLAEKRTHQER
ncbi:hypothetical protein GCM10009834_09130 [Streptomonospora arabica]|uniref:Uncharacterized protein n=1 Tax=Streptomonospora halophila TaxID=427369 RepID=A0ABP9GGL1_9ACTN